MSQTSVRRSGGRQVNKKKARSNTPLLVGLIAVVVVIVALVITRLTGGGDAAGAQQFPDLGGNLHLQAQSDPLPVPYNSNPPTSGYHFGGGTAPWGIQTQPLDDKLTLHNLEHGGVIIHYRQDSPKETVDQLTTIARELQQLSPCVIMEPRANDQIDAPIIMTSWTWMLKLQTVDADAIRAFFRTHVDHGPERTGCEIGR